MNTSKFRTAIAGGDVLSSPTIRLGRELSIRINCGRAPPRDRKKLEAANVRHSKVGHNHVQQGLPQFDQRLETVSGSSHFHLGTNELPRVSSLRNYEVPEVRTEFAQLFLEWRDCGV